MPQMRCEFEEKQFETALNHHLVASHNLIYATGQVLEHTLGFDAALFTRSNRFWRMFPHISPWYARLFRFHPEGVEIKKEWWRIVGEEIEHFPPLKFNVFIQHKRPFFLTSRTTGEWTHWQRSYFKYKLTHHQQLALEQLSERMQNSALVVYASPAFYRFADLWASSQDNSLIDKTNFVEARLLHNHASYSYISGGADGLGHSDPTPIRGRLFEEHLERLQKQDGQKLGNKEIIIKWAETINATAIGNAGISTNYLRLVADLTKEIAEFRLAAAFARIDAFCFLTNTICFFGFGDDSGRSENLAEEIKQTKLPPQSEEPIGRVRRKFDFG